MSSVLECDALSYAYLDRFPALDRVSLEVRRGERLALLGANGCGKSTLLKLLDGLLFADGGTLHAFGHEVTEAALEDEQFSRAFRSRVGFVFQNSDAQVFSPTVREEVAFGPLQLGLGWPTAARTSSRGESASAWPSPPCSRRTPRCCCSTSPPPASTRARRPGCSS
jgi:energy-coupling factor transporter ATP-binding protein EcfA2